MIRWLRKVKLLLGGSSGVAALGMPTAPAGLFQADGSIWVPTSQTSPATAYDWDTDTTATDPGAGNLKVNNSDLNLVTAVYMSATTKTGGAVGQVFDETASGDVADIVYSRDNTNFLTLRVNGQAIDNSGWLTIPVEVLDTNGAIPDGEAVTLGLLASSPRVRNIRLERIFDAESVAATQDPTGLGPGAAHQIEFGPAQKSGSDPAMISALGAVTINQAGLYRIKVTAQIGRTGASLVSEVLVRALFNGVQAGASAGFRVANADSFFPFRDEQWLQLPAGVVITYEVMRDAAGTDSGGLIGQSVTAGAGSWNQDPCAAIRVERLVNA